MEPYLTNFRDRLIEFIADKQTTSWAHEHIIQDDNRFPYAYAIDPKDGSPIMAGDAEHYQLLLLCAARIGFELNRNIAVAIYGECDIFTIDKLYKEANQCRTFTRVGLVWVNVRSSLNAAQWLQSKAHRHGTNLTEILTNV
jgi:hypothetical protein